MTDCFFEYGTDDNYAVVGDAYDSTPTKVELLSGVYAQGQRPKKQIPAQYFNMLLSKLGTKGIVGANADTTYTPGPGAARTVIRCGSTISANRAYTLGASGVRTNEIVHVWADPACTKEVTVKDQAGVKMFVVGNIWSSDGQAASFIYDGSTWLPFNAFPGAHRPNVEMARTLTLPSDLNALTGMADLDTRRVPGYGPYVYRSASTAYVDGELVVYANGVSGSSPGRWLQEDYKAKRPRFLKSDTQYFSGAAIDMSSFTPDAPDPANRNSGNVGKIICQSFNGADTFDLRNGDLLQVSYAVEFQCPNSHNSDVVVGVCSSNGNVFHPNTISRFGQTTGTYGNGTLYTSGAFGTDGANREFLSRTVDIIVGVDITITEGANFMKLVAAPDAFAFGLIQQSSMLSVSHYRLTL